jgi:hypothetical protein
MKLVMALLVLLGLPLASPLGAQPAASAPGGAESADALQGKLARPEDRLAAKAAEGNARVAITQLSRSLGVDLDSPAGKAGRVALMKFQEGDRAVTDGRYLDARRFYANAEAFARRAMRQGPDPCDAARSNVERLRDLQRRLERATLRSQSDLPRALVARARDLIDDALRQIDAGQCAESLRTSRLAENALKRAGELALQSRR